MSPHDKSEAQQFVESHLAERYDGVRSTRMPDPHPALLAELDAFALRRRGCPALDLSDAAFEALVDAWFAPAEDGDCDDEPAARRPDHRLSAAQLGVGRSFGNW